MPQAGNCGYGFVYETFTSDIPNDVTAQFSRVQCNYGAFLRPVYSTYFRNIPADTAGEFVVTFQSMLNAVKLIRNSAVVCISTRAIHAIRFLHIVKLKPDSLVSKNV